MYVCVVSVWYLRGAEEGYMILWTGVIDGCDPPCGHWELNLGPLDEESVLLTTEHLCSSTLKIYISTVKAYVSVFLFLLFSLWLTFAFYSRYIYFLFSPTYHLLLLVFMYLSDDSALISDSI